MNPERLEALLEAVRAVQESVCGLEREIMASLAESEGQSPPPVRPEDGADEWFTISELGAWLKVGRTTVYKWISTGDIPSHRIGRTVRVRSSDVEKWLKSNREYLVRYN